jgi:hypothetical protein
MLTCNLCGKKYKTQKALRDHIAKPGKAHTQQPAPTRQRQVAAPRRQPALKRPTVTCDIIHDVSFSDTTPFFYSMRSDYRSDLYPKFKGVIVKKVEVSWLPSSVPTITSGRFWMTTIGTNEDALTGEQIKASSRGWSVAATDMSKVVVPIARYDSRLLYGHQEQHDIGGVRLCFYPAFHTTLTAGEVGTVKILVSCEYTQATEV